jgi:hypothetical protein
MDPFIHLSFWVASYTYTYTYTYTYITYTYTYINNIGLFNNITLIYLPPANPSPNQPARQIE